MFNTNIMWLSTPYPMGKTQAFVICMLIVTHIVSMFLVPQKRQDQWAVTFMPALAQTLQICCYPWLPDQIGHCRYVHLHPKILPISPLDFSTPEVNYVDCLERSIGGIGCPDCVGVMVTVLLAYCSQYHRCVITRVVCCYHSSCNSLLPTKDIETNWPTGHMLSPWLRGLWKISWAITLVIICLNAKCSS